MDFGKPIFSKRDMPSPIKAKPKRKRSARAKVTSGQASMFDNYGHEPLRVEELMTTIDLAKSQFSLGGMMFEFDPAPREPALAMRMTVAGLKETYLAYGSWHRSKPPLEIESWSFPCNWFVVAMRPKRDDGVIRASFCKDTKSLAISLPHSTSWKGAGLLWLASYTYCCQRHSKNPRPWMPRTCDCAVD